MNPSRLTIFTGKGGVGKTSSAMGFAYALKEEGHKVVLYSFEDSPQYPPLEEWGIEVRVLELFKSVEAYVAEKLKSKIIAKSIVSSKFFRSLLNMLPGFSYLIYLGDMLDKLKKDPELHLVLDAPSSGHMVTLFESAFNFKEIFKTGNLVKDIDKLVDYAYSPGILKVVIVTLPHLLSLAEGLELKENLQGLKVPSIELWANQYLPSLLEQQKEKLPEILQEKIKIEKETLEKFGKDSKKIIPYALESSGLEFIKALSKEIRREENHALS